MRDAVVYHKAVERGDKVVNDSVGCQYFSMKKAWEIFCPVQEAWLVPVCCSGQVVSVMMRPKV